MDGSGQTQRLAVSLQNQDYSFIDGDVDEAEESDAVFKFRRKTALGGQKKTGKLTKPFLSLSLSLSPI